MVTRKRKVCEKSYVVNAGLLSSSLEATADSEEGAPSDTEQSQVQLYRKFCSTPSFLRWAHRGLESSMACLWAPQNDCFSLDRRDQESWWSKEAHLIQRCPDEGYGIDWFTKFVEGWGAVASASFGTRFLTIPGLSFRLSDGFFLPETFFTKLEVVLLVALGISSSTREGPSLFLSP